MPPIIEVEEVVKRFPLRRGPRALLGRGGLARWFTGTEEPELRALDGVSLQVEPGEAVGIIGANGSGKSTLLKLLAGVSVPTSGAVRVRGRVASLLELGAGFHPMLTGRENVYLNAGLLGMRHAQVDEVFDEIVAFSGIGEFIDQPVETYSSGMYVRIAFAVAVYTDPDIFLVDEVLAVGDEAFQRQCRRRMGELRAEGKTLLFVSHDLGMVHALCDRIVMLHRGALLSRATPQATIAYYLRQVGRDEAVHTMRDGALEVIFNSGSVAMFYEGEEITAGGGLTGAFESYGSFQPLQQADWRITERSAAHCIAEGVLPRLPLRARMELQLHEDVLVWRLGFEVLRAAQLEGVLALLSVPASLSQYRLDAEQGECGDIAPGTVDQSIVVPARARVRQADLTTREDAERPVSVCIDHDESDARTTVQLTNTDYLQHARLVVGHRRFPRDGASMAGGHTETPFVWRVAVRRSRALAEARAAGERARTTVAFDGGSARFDRGRIELFDASERPLSAAVHLHTQSKHGRLWLLSEMHVWEAPERDGEAVVVRGAPQRAAFRETWRLHAAGGGLHWQVWLEAAAPATLDEWNVSLALDAAYTQWTLGDVPGAFPAFDPADEEWRHCNETYASGRTMRAEGAGLPPITLDIEQGTPLLSALNTGHAQHARVLQALYTPSRAGALAIAPPRQLYFQGTLRIATDG